MSLKTGRWKASVDGEIVVFLIGMRVNRPWKIRQWSWVFAAMPTMLIWLSRHPQEGLLHYEFSVRDPLSPVVTQYWRSFEDLERFARSPDAPHLGPWKRFNAEVRDSGDVGIWHETYRVAAGAGEAIYVNMPRRGVGRAGDLTPVGTTATTAAQRIGARADDEPPVAPY